MGDLGKRFAQGGEAELDEVVQVYGEKLLRYATSIMGRYQDAEDVVQEVLLLAYQKRRTFDGAHLSAWLYKITYRTCLNQLNRQKTLFLADMDILREHTIDPFGNAPVREGILAALEQLSAEERALIFCRVVDEQSYEALSQVFGRSPETLRKQVERAKKKLVGHLKAQGFTGKEFGNELL